jgi:hypothetical protein
MKAELRRDEMPEVLRLHLDNRPIDTEIGFLVFDKGTVAALAAGEHQEDLLETLPLGDYLGIVLAHVGWWMQAADLAAGMTSSQNLRGRLSGLRDALGDILALVPEAWSETTLHCRSAPSTSTGRVLLSRYLRLRMKVFGFLSAAMPTVKLDSLVHLA